MIGTGYPVQFSVDYPDRSLDRLTTAFRIVIVIPIAVVLGMLAGTMATPRRYTRDQQFGGLRRCGRGLA